MATADVYASTSGMPVLDKLARPVTIAEVFQCCIEMFDILGKDLISSA
jgi:hypothetical protein